VTDTGLFYSPDGRAWTGVSGGDTSREVVFGDGLFIATGYTGKIQYSLDGIHWKVERIAAGTFLGLAYGDGKFVMSSDNGNVLQTGYPDNVPLKPAIIYEPTDLHLAAGDSAEMRVRARGAGPMTYRWFKNNVELAGETGAALVIASASAANFGDYRVEVSNAHGAATSRTAHVNVTGVEVPLTLSVVRTEAGLRVGVIGQPGKSVRLEKRTDLNSGQWELIEVLTMTGSEISRDFSIASGNLFIRAVQVN
jgi:hypothetical protein